MNNNKKINVVLFQPEIAENTGNIGRTCVGFDATLHLIRPYGFVLNDKRMKRSSLDYWPKLTFKQYDCWEEFEIENNINENSNNIFFMSKKANVASEDLDFGKINEENIYFVFGRETKGLSDEIMTKYKNKLFRIDMSENIRSYNLSNCVAMMVYDCNKYFKKKK